MSDTKNVGTDNTNEKSGEKNKPSTTEKSTVKSEQSTAKNAKSTKTTTATSKTTTSSPANKVSKTAIFASALAVLSLAGVVGHYFWQQQQTQLILDDMLVTVSEQMTKNQQQVSEAFDDKLARIQTKHQQEITTLRKQLLLESKASVKRIQKQLATLSEQQPSDWLLHEAEYLIRLASRSIWLEKNTDTAIALLQDADLRITSLKDPQYLPLRQLIQQDIARLKLLPKLATDDVILSLMALEQQVDQLIIAMAKVPESVEPEQDLTLSRDLSDWQENLAKTWQQFLNTFITINRRTGRVKPLMAPEHQQYLRENLRLTIENAIWASRHENTDIYQQSLSKINKWLAEYFDMNEIINQNFNKQINELKGKVISANFPNHLASLSAIRAIVSNENKLFNNKTATLELENKAPAEDSKQKTSNKDKVKAEKVTADKEEKAPAQQTKPKTKALEKV